MPDVPDVIDAEQPGAADRIREAYAVHVGDRQRAALRMWIAFILTFLFLRGLTYGIKYHYPPFGNIVTPGGLHIHHFVWGIFILIVVGFLALILEQSRWHPWLAVPFGIGAALVVDEFALWLNLQDVYWAQEGRISVDLGILVAALLGIFWAAARFWTQLAREMHAATRLMLRRRG